ALGRPLRWGTSCYDPTTRRFVLFSGGNVQSARGDPGTWTYTPADNAWVQLRPDKQPPQRANSRLVYDPVAKKVVLFGGDGLDRLLSDTRNLGVAAGKGGERRPARCPPPRARERLA